MSHTSRLAFVICAALSASVLAGDWPQWAGPNRDFSVQGAELADRWPEQGPPRLWSRELGVGYSGIVSAGDLLYTMYRKSRTDPDEYTVALNATTGKTVWEFKNPAPLVGPPAEPSDTRWGGQGPNSTPLIVGDRLYTVGSRALMHCHERASGKLLWKRDLAEEFGATYAGRKNNDTGYASSPIAYGNAVIVSLGRSRVGDAKPGRSLVALDQVDGSVLWKGLDFDGGFASPLLVEIDGQRQLVLHVKGEVIGVDPNDGRLLWSQQMTSNWEPTVTPVWNRGSGILVIDGDAARLIELTTTEGRTIPKEAWSSSKMNAVVPTPVLVGERFYGSTRTMLVSVGAKTGEHVWTERGYPLVSIVHADGKLIMLDENGQLTLATVGSDGLTVHSRCTVTEKYSLTAPALAGKILFIRDRKRILALALG